MAAQHLCGCGRDAIDIVRVATEDGILLISVCSECAEDPAAGEQRDLFDASEWPHRPLATIPVRDDDAQPSLPLDDIRDEERGAA